LKILYIVDPEKSNFIFKDRIMEFFASSGFQIIAQLAREQQKLNFGEATNQVKEIELSYENAESNSIVSQRK